MLPLQCKKITIKMENDLTDPFSFARCLKLLSQRSSIASWVCYFVVFPNFVQSFPRIFVSINSGFHKENKQVLWERWATGKKKNENDFLLLYNGFYFLSHITYIIAFGIFCTIRHLCTLFVFRWVSVKNLIFFRHLFLEVENIV